jgi:hypothetical protein
MGVVLQPIQTLPEFMPPQEQDLGKFGQCRLSVIK